MNKSGAREIIKSSSIVAGAQVIQIIFGIVRTKLIAILLGPVGVGESGLFQTTTQLIGSIFGIGISQSSVKSIAEKAQEDKGALNQVISSALILISFFGLLGTFLTIIFSKELSNFTFKTEDYSTPISILAVSILFNLLYATYSAVAQGLRKLKLLAKISVFSSVISLFTTIPLYYYFGTKGIVPALIVMSFTNLGISFFFVRPLFVFIKPRFKDFTMESIALIKVGIALALSGIFMMSSSYFIRVFITEESGMRGVGLLNAATAITTLYLSLIFTAMSTDFFPKLAGLKNDINAVNKVVNEQINTGLIIAGPIITIFVSFSFLILNLLYSKEFIGATELMQYQLLGTLFKAFSWPIGFILLTKNLSNIFIFTELFWNLSYYLITVFLWNIVGLSAVGISYLISFFLLTIIVYLIAKKHNKFKIEVNAIKTFILMTLVSFSVFITIKLVESYYLKWFLVFVFNMVGIFYSYFYLKNLYNFKEILNSVLQRVFK